MVLTARLEQVLFRWLAGLKARREEAKRSQSFGILPTLRREEASVKTRFTQLIRIYHDRTSTRVLREAEVAAGLYGSTWDNLLEREKDRLVSILHSNGFVVLDGPGIVTHADNFDNLNIPAGHPAREEHGFFTTCEGYVLRSHTTSVHSLAGSYHSREPRISVIGKVFRDDKDRTHLNIFHQTDLLVKERTTVSGFLRLINSLMRDFFEREELRVTIRPSYFPFTTMSFEIDVTIDGVPYEVAGAGLINNEVVRINGAPEDSFWPAIGFGLERLVMVKHGLKDIRDCYQLVRKWG